MRPFYEYFDGIDFGDELTVSRVLREQRREEQRLASRRVRGRKDASHLDAFEDYDQSSEYPDYDADEFDRYSDLGKDH